VRIVIKNGLFGAKENKKSYKMIYCIKCHEVIGPESVTLIRDCGTEGDDTIYDLCPSCFKYLTGMDIKK